MKRLLIFVFLSALYTLSVQSQVPQKMTYQAVVRDGHGQLITNSNVSVRINVLKGSETGQSVFSQSEMAHTNANGIFILTIGGNGFEDIDWGSGVYYMRSEIDPNGGSNYTMTNVQQMMSVPFALHAGYVDNVVGGVNITETQTLTDVSSLGNDVRTQIKQLSDPTELLDAVNLITLNTIITDWRHSLDSMAQAMDSIIHRYDSIITGNIDIIDSLQDVITEITSTKYGDTAAIECDSFSWYGNNYVVSGDYTHVFNVSGIDSIVTLHLTINYSATSDTVAVECNNFVWYGNYYTISGSSTHGLSTIAGCDSIVTLHLTINGSTHNSETVTSDNEYVWHEVTYNESGTYTYSYINSQGCSSADTLHLSVNISPFDSDGGTNSQFGSFSFSRGNLLYKSGTWRFAIEQYYDPFDSTWQDGFCWGTSGWNSGATRYSPTSNPSNNSDYYVGGNYVNDLTGSYARADWGVYNAISNGGNRAGVWRTMTTSEWKRILFQRDASTLNGTDNARYAKSKINGISGIIVFPNAYTHPSDVPYPSDINVAGSDYPNIYTVEQWHKMERAGCIFLPAGNYWTSEHHDGLGETYYYADYLVISSSEVKITYGTRGSRRHVRLVKSHN